MAFRDAQVIVELVKAEDAIIDRWVKVLKIVGRTGVVVGALRTRNWCSTDNVLNWLTKICMFYVILTTV